MENQKIIQRTIKILSIITALVLTACLCFYFFHTLPKEREYQKLREQVQQYYNDKVSAFETENGTLTGDIDAVFLGDSLTDGYNLATFYPQFKTLNRGIGADTTVGLEKRLEVSVYAVQPKVAVMLIGGNNLYTMFDNYENILQGFKQNIPNTKIVLLSLTPMAKNSAYKNPTSAYNNAIIKALAVKYEYTYIDIFTPLFDLETRELCEEYTEDGVHFTDKGYEVLTNTITPILTELING